MKYWISEAFCNYRERPCIDTRQFASRTRDAAGWGGDGVWVSRQVLDLSITVIVEPSPGEWGLFSEVCDQWVGHIIPIGPSRVNFLCHSGGISSDATWEFKMDQVRFHKNARLSERWGRENAQTIEWGQQEKTNG